MSQDCSLVDQLLLKLERERTEPAPQSPIEEFWDEITFLFRDHSIDKNIELCHLHRTENGWLKDSLHRLLTGSPTSIRVIDAHLKRCKQLALKDVMQLDWHLSLSFLKGHDFSEGVRAVLIDKDQHAQWNPKKLAETPSKVIDEHFQLHDNPRNPVDFLR